MSLLYTTFAILIGIGGTLAQLLQPVPVHSMAYATIDESTLYILGGAASSDNSNPTNQFYSLNLAKPTWDTSNPPWDILNVGAAISGVPPTSNHLMTVADGGQSLVVCYSYGPIDNNKTIIPTIIKYNVSSSTWLTQLRLPADNDYVVSASVVRSAATDPIANFVYIPGARHLETSMVVFSSAAYNSTKQPDISSFTNVTMPSIPIPGRVLSGYSATWSDYRKSILLLGGRYEISLADLSTQPGIFVDMILEYKPSVGSWSSVDTKGAMPVNITRHCTVQAKNGTKLVVFGGSSSPNADIVPLGDIHILDVPTMTWSRGKSADSSQFRAAMACSVAGDNFIAWGGTDGAKALNSTIIYDLKNDQWTNKYVRSVSGATNNTGKNIGAITGGSIAAVLVIGLAIGYFVYRRRKQNYQSQVSHKDAPQDKDMTDKNTVSPAVAKRDPHVPIDTLYSTGIPRNPSLLPAGMESQFINPQQARNPEYAPQTHYQGFARTDPQYSETPLQEPWRNPQGYAIPELIMEDDQLKQQWILEQQYLSMMREQQQQQEYWSNLEKLRQELEILQSELMAMLPLERQLYTQLWEVADVDKAGFITGSEAVPFFAKSGLPSTTLGEIWELVDTDNKGVLAPNSFNFAVRLIAHAQNGKKLSSELFHTESPLPYFEGITPYKAGTSSLSFSRMFVNQNISNEDKLRHLSLFRALEPTNGLLDGEKAREAFLKSRLSVEKLSQIWYA
ncbi:hypothetical protein FBU30_008364 [Linnemannia zychae]|nr:hypothetical protein FBU30_008364 [Linnemannia zychae]